MRPEFNLSWCHFVAWPCLGGACQSHRDRGTHPGGSHQPGCETRGHAPHQVAVSGPRCSLHDAQAEPAQWHAVWPRRWPRGAAGPRCHAATCPTPPSGSWARVRDPHGPARASEPPGGRDRPPARLLEMSSAVSLGVFHQEAHRQQWGSSVPTRHSQPPRGVTRGTVPHVRAGGGSGVSCDPCTRLDAAGKVPEAHCRQPVLRGALLLRVWAT